MEKVLILASVASMIKQFNMPNIRLLQEMGYEVHVACNFEKGDTISIDLVNELKMKLLQLNVSYYQIDFARKIPNLSEHLKAYKQVTHLLSMNDYSFIHCHSPIGGVIGRLSAHKTKTKVIYTAHGFHFFEGAPKKNWLLYYPVERLLAHYTDLLITINKEDYQRAQNFKAKKIVYIPGVGIDVKKFEHVNVDRNAKQRELGIREGKVVLLSIGELCTRKNHEVVIKALAKLNNSNMVYLICGNGDLYGYLENLSNQLKVDVKLLGFRKEIPEIFAATDIFVLPSLQEGLPVALMEAMAAGLPVICSQIRGNVDLIENDKNGYLVNPNNVQEFADAIDNITSKDSSFMGEINRDKIKYYDIQNINEKMGEIYRDKILF